MSDERLLLILQAQQRTLKALVIPPHAIATHLGVGDDIIGDDGEPKWMPGDPDDGPIVSMGDTK